MLCAAAAGATSNIDPDSTGRRYGWAENAGFLNLKPDPDNGVRVRAFGDLSIVSGYAWHENVGWIHFGDGTPDAPPTYSNTSATDYGVNVNPATGALSGFAWGENIGWINFNTAAASGQAVTLNASTGGFSGQAWSENLGWIGFDGLGANGAAVPVGTLPVPYTQQLASSLTSSDGWSALGQSGPLFTAGIGSRGYDGGNTALTAVVAPSPRGRIIGWVEDSSVDLPYSQIGSDKFVRAKFSMVYSGPGDSSSEALFNRVPNFRLSLRTRGVVTTQLEVNHNAQTGGSPAQAFVTRELSPSKIQASPSLYRVDLDPVDAPYWSGSTTEGVQRGFETLVSGADYSFVEGALLMTDSSIGTYPALSEAVAPTKSFVVGGSAGASDFDNSGIVLASLGYSAAEIFRYIAGPAAADYFNPTILNFTINSEAGVTIAGSPQGITVNSGGLPTNRIAVADAAINGGVFGETTATRLRVEPDRLYRVSFRLKHDGASDTTPYTRFNARTAGFGWNTTLELLGARGLPGLDARAALAQVLPGAGNQVPGTTADGTVYHLLFSTPLTPGIRADVAGSLAQKFPNLSAQPGPGDPNPGPGNPAAGSLRNVNFGFTMVDSLSLSSPTATDPAEVANALTLNRVEVRTYPQIQD
jgi:hypothetical protein